MSFVKTWLAPMIGEVERGDATRGAVISPRDKLILAEWGGKKVSGGPNLLPFLGNPLGVPW